ncbi:MAG: molecular chaperone HtpG [Cytophagaceae bacterium]|nr:molecular chaperone HtpG [Cytophagaceae bacterium]
MQEKGSISIHTENIFPIIKKFLYSDQEIFLRELVSNAVDACQKLSKLASLGEYKGELGELNVTVSLDETAKTITISDNGIGMTAEEIKKYINQIAFSGATEFLEKYKDKGDEKQIIGHFGLGFYSAFMVAGQVEIVTLSHQEGASAARWVCDGSTEFEISAAAKESRGTDIILHVSEDAQEYLQKYRLKQILDKYCKFLPVSVSFDGETINETKPLWTRTPSELSDDDYLKFYRELHPMNPDPLFWIHLNVDYPFNLTGILYFPKLKQDIDPNRSKIHLYSRQVFITDEVKDVMPDFLMLMHGVLDSPDIPLNVSRSYLQSDSNVKKINSHITKKVADKLMEIFNKDRPVFEEKWNDVSMFVKYGMLSDEKFYERAKDFCLVSNCQKKYFTLAEYKEHVKTLQTDKDGNIVWLYTKDAAKQDLFIRQAEQKGYDVLVMDSMIDSHFVMMLEEKQEKVSLKRVDADTMEKLIPQEVKLEVLLNQEQQDSLKKLFEATLQTKATVEVQALSAEDLPVVITLPEFFRRMQEMQQANGMFKGMGMPEMFTLSINSNHPAVQKILEVEDGRKSEMARQAVDLALLSQGMLTGKELTDFIKRSVQLSLN